MYRSFRRAAKMKVKKRIYEEYSFDHSTLLVLHAGGAGYIPTYGRELPRGEVIAYPTAQEAAAASAGDTRYFTRLADWTQKDNVFSTEFTVPFAWANRQVFFHLGWASADYEVRVNGKSRGL